MNFTEHTKIRKEKFGAVVFDTLTEKIFITDEIGSDILQLVKQGMDVPEIVSTLAASYDGDPEAMEKDIAEFAEQLKSNKIIADSAQE